MGKTLLRGWQLEKSDFIKSEGSGEVDWDNNQDTASMKAISSLVAEAHDRHFTYEWRKLLDRVDIAHNLHKKPSVTVVDTAGNELFCDVAYTDDDNLTLIFSCPIRGTAYLN